MSTPAEPETIDLDELTSSEAIVLAHQGRVSPFSRLDVANDDVCRRLLAAGVRQLGAWDAAAEAWVVPTEKQAALGQLLDDLGIRAAPYSERATD